MSRQDNRATVRENQRKVKIYKSLSPLQITFVDDLTEHKALIMIEEFIKLYDAEAFKVMRSQRVGKERAKRILDIVSENLQKGD